MNPRMTAAHNKAISVRLLKELLTTEIGVLYVLFLVLTGITSGPVCGSCAGVYLATVVVGAALFELY